jgi:hypothetical protein
MDLIPFPRIFYVQKDLSGVNKISPWVLLDFDEKSKAIVFHGKETKQLNKETKIPTLIPQRSNYH